MNKGSNLKLACFNVRSICNKTTGVLEALKDHSIGICCITESWLKKDDKAKFAEIHELGYDLFSAPRKGVGGGVAFIFNPLVVKPIRNNVAKYSSFEVLECVIKSSTGLIRLCVIYRSTQITSKERYNLTKTSLFFDQFGEYLDSLQLKGGSPILCGDFNFHVEDKFDAVAQKFVTLCKSRGFIQHIDKSTHIAGGTLDLVLTRNNITDHLPITNLEIEEATGTTSDHFLVSFEIPVSDVTQTETKSEIKEFRELSKLDIESFKQDILSSGLNSPDLFISLEDTVQLYNETLTKLLDKHSPVVTRKFKTNDTPWWNIKCQDARTKRRKHQRAYAKEKSPETLASYKEACVDASIIIDRERNKYYHKKMDSHVGNPRETYKVINNLLDKEYGKNTFPNGENDASVANNLKDFFDSKVKKIYAGIESENGKNANGAKGIPPDDQKNEPKGSFTSFGTMQSSQLADIIKAMPDKSCALDTIPMWLFKECLPELLPAVSYIVNESLSSGAFPCAFKTAAVRPVLKKKGLDCDVLANYRPISNLTFLSKIIEKCVNSQIVQFINSHNLFAGLQSGYRKTHSCETAITKIHNDILMMIDKKHNVLLLLLDLSAAFDTVCHTLLLKKLKNAYGINGKALAWFESYLSDRSFTVKVNKSSSSSCQLTIGVPQGSILGPLLFILYTKDLQELVNQYGLSVHLYADDTQIYFSFDINCTNPDLSQIQACFSEIKKWMAANFLKLNEDKTKALELGVYENCITSSVPLGTHSIELSEKAKNLGFYFDDQMSLESQVNNVTKNCFMNLRNLRRIGSKLSHSLKVQLVQSMIFSHLDYCNAVYGSLSEANLNKLQKIQYAAVQFIYGLSGKDRFQPLSPFLKELHFLPVRSRIRYKVALMTFKCINNIAPHYLSEMITLRDPNRHELRIDSDFYVLKSPPRPNYKRTEGTFSVTAPTIWNDLPHELRCMTELNAFKKKLKTYYIRTVFGEHY